MGFTFNNSNLRPEIFNTLPDSLQNNNGRRMMGNSMMGRGMMNGNMMGRGMMNNSGSINQIKQIKTETGLPLKKLMNFRIRSRKLLKQAEKAKQFSTLNALHVTVPTEKATDLQQYL